MKRLMKILCGSLPILLLFASSATAGLTEYGFRNILNTTGLADDIAPQLSFTVEPRGTSQVLFTIYNNRLGWQGYTANPIAGSITAVFFDDGALFGIADVQDSTGVDFTYPSNQKVLPQGGNVDPAFVVTEGFSAKAVPDPISNGVSAGESVGIVFNLQTGKSFSNVLAALLADPANEEVDSLRLGLHIQNIGNTGASASDGFVNLVPLPGSVLLGAFAVGLAGRKLRKFV